ncbi:WG repeat-containing protein [Bradyrhizobium erythrophlei]|uniref:WG containing repeat-containing protein n=1 Tax=Bradyrhizobium erythrophlei TaxID=1437360 RepID=A0A1M7TAW5_9BRAD|nr:WG repeat-containing protein [Bradyrhizobium erythrophlei]SHN67870.1 WG containing repeat-containing protein [Bradyrhizobium erythrophlei]
MFPMRLMFAILAAATLVSATPSLAQTCRPMDNSAVGIDTGVTDLIPQRCDDQRKCQMFAMDGRPIGEPGDRVVPRTATANGVVAVEKKQSGLQGYMSVDGAWKVEPQFKQAGPYCENRAAVQRVDSLWVYLDPKGEEVGSPRDAAEAFTEGLGLVTSYKGGHDFRHGYVDTSGKVVIPVTFAGARLFSEGLAAVLVDGKWGYIDRDGKMIIPPRFAEADTFHNGRAVVSISASWGKSGLIDRSGKFVVEPRYEQISKVGEKFWSVGGIDRSYRGNGEPPALVRLVDAEGHLVSKQVYNSFGAVQDGLMSVCRDDRCGFMDTSGKLVIPLKYKGAGDFQEGLAAVTSDGDSYGFIDRNGKTVLAARYESLGPHKEHFTPGPFVNGLAPAGCKGSWGFIDKSGAWAIPPVYRFAESFDNGFASVEVRGGTAHLRPDGSAIDFTPAEIDAAAPPTRPCGVPLARAPH